MAPMKNPLLHAYWIEFEPSPDGGQTFMAAYTADVAHLERRAVGVTAFTVDDALSILDEELFSGGPRPPGCVRRRRRRIGRRRGRLGSRPPRTDASRRCGVWDRRGTAHVRSRSAVRSGTSPSEGVTRQV